MPSARIPEEAYLTALGPRARQVLMLQQRGHTPKEIAVKLGYKNVRSAEIKASAARSELVLLRERLRPYPSQHQLFFLGLDGGTRSALLEYIDGRKEILPSLMTPRALLRIKGIARKRAAEILTLWKARPRP